MATSLIQGASSAYIAAQNALKSKRVRPDVYVYVEGLEDVAFWKECLRPFCLNYSFKVTQLRKPDGSIAEGKRHLIECIGLESLGPNKYVAVDADYDWIINDYRPSTSTCSISCIIRDNPYILHTFLYSIENYKCHPLCLAAMMDKIAGGSVEEGILNLFDSFSLAIADLFLIHLVSTDRGDGIFTLRDFRKVVEALTFDGSSMGLDVRSLEFIDKNKYLLEEYIDQIYDEVAYYRRKLRDYGFAENKYHLLMQGHIIENVLVKKHLPVKILELRRQIQNEICNCGNEDQIGRRLKQFEKLTGITTRTESNYPKSTKALLKDIKSRLDQVIYDCNDVSKAIEGYVFLRQSLENAFGTPSY